MQPRLKRDPRREQPLWAQLAPWLVAGALLGCSSSGGRSLATTSEPIAGGELDRSHNNVFLLASHFAGKGGLCTSTLIAPNLLLTARHCVSPNTGTERVLCGDSSFGDPYPPRAFAATNDAQPSDQSPVFHAAEVRVPDSGNDTCGYDVALIILDEQVPESLAVPAVPRIDREVQPGEQYTAVGYGENDAGLPLATRIERKGLSIACEPGSCGEGVESTEFLGETGICSGDSGGPALDADGKVVGVVSRGGPNCDTPVYGPVTAWYDLIVSTATDVAALGGYEAPFWVTTGSSDPPLLAGDGGAGGAGGEPPPVTCPSTADCADGLVCQPAGDVSVCAMPTARGRESGGCSISARRSGAALGTLLLAGTALLLRSRRRH